MAEKHYFHFTLGPVQGFVAQARRTRDFWAGSFLLSWLSGVAILAVKQQQGKILFPAVDDSDFLQAIAGEEIESTPLQGSIPNRFKAGVGADFNAQLVIDAVQQAWQALATEIYDKEVAPYQEADTKEIWERQIKYFWDMSWAITEDETDSSILDRRKNWRNQYIPPEAGVKCSLMRDWQEISGILGIKRADKAKRDQFWQQVSQNHPTNYKDNEYLCAMSLVKRRFVTYFKTFKADLNNGFSVRGWDVPENAPSITYIAAANWYADFLTKLDQADREEFVKLAKELGGLSEFKSNIRCLKKLTETKGFRHQDISLDGNIFHQAVLANANNFKDKDKTVLNNYKKVFKDLTQKYQMPAITPFYAVLIMDGDQLGKQMSCLSKQPLITKGLREFTDKVGSIVAENNGYLIYAGGDDVLALLTLEDAMACAYKIRQHYQACFEGKEVKTSISAAIIYAHFRLPLSNILHDSHLLLDEIAKEQTGRNAIAVQVVKPGGISLSWAKKWKDAVSDNGDKFILEQLAKDFLDAKNNDTAEDRLSSGFFYRIRERFAELDINSIGFDTACELLAVDYVRSNQAAGKKITLNNTTIEKMKKLLSQCQDENKQINADAGLLVRFLAKKGVER